MNIPGFQILEVAGEGGMAIVYKAYQSSLDRIVAIKVLKSEFAKDQDQVISFVREARLAAKIKHPNIIQIYDVSEIDGQFYFIMEYVAGQTVHRMISNDGPMQVQTALKVCKTVAGVLESAWEKQRVLHRDIKPDNIMIDHDGSIKLADLGLCVGRDNLSGLTQGGNFVEGTPNYMSPEQACGHSGIDLRSDMYSLGASFYHMITGQLPFGGLSSHDTMDMQVRGKLRNPKEIIKEIPVGAAQLAARLMMKEPKDRYRSWRECIKDIDELIKSRNHTINCEGDSTVIAPTTEASRKPVSAMSAGNRPAPRSPIKIAPVQASQKTESHIQKISGSEQGMPAWLTILIVAVAVIGIGFTIYVLTPPSRQVQLAPNRTRPAIEPRKPEVTKAVTPTPQNTSEAGQEAEQANPTAGNNTTTSAGNNSGTSSESEKEAAASFENGASPSTDANPSAYSEAVKNTANLVAELKFTEAVDVLSKAEATEKGSTKINIYKLKLMLEGVSQYQKVIESAIRVKANAIIDMNVKGASHHIRIKSVSNGKVLADKISGIAGSATKISMPFDFNVTDISTDERIKLLGAITTPNRATMKYLLLLEAKRYDDAVTTAKDCGLLAEALAEVAAAKKQ